MAETAVTHQYFTDSLINGTPAPKMIWVSPGKFTMGDIQGVGLNDEVPAHEVTISKRFAIGKHPVTFDEYDLFTRMTNYKQANDRQWGRGKRPVINVSWIDANAYTKWLSEQTGKHYRLPTEAEWEFATRGGTSTAYWWGNTMLTDMAHCYECGDNIRHTKTTTVASFKPNPFGLYDTYGNVWEWTASRWTQSYNGEELKQINQDEVVIAPNYLKAAQLAMRGGAWNLLPKFNRSSSRFYGPPHAKSWNLGFRIARTE